MTKNKNTINPLALKSSKKLPEDMSDDEFFDFIENNSLADYWDEFEEVKDVTIKRPKLPDKKEKP